MRKLSENDLHEIARRAREGERGTAIAAAFGVHPSHVSRILRGQRHCGVIVVAGIETSLHDRQTGAIVAMRREGASTTEIAAETGKNAGTVWRILKRAAPDTVAEPLPSRWW